VSVPAPHEFQHMALARHLLAGTSQPHFFIVNIFPLELPPEVVTLTYTFPDIPEGTFTTILELLQK
jgi:hypothetical protein